MFAAGVRDLRYYLWAVVIMLEALGNPLWGSSLQVKTEEAFGGRLGGAIVMDARSGKVVAVVRPDISAQGLHPPGSIFKLVTAFAALQERAVDCDGVFQCNGGIKIGQCSLNCTLPNGHGRITFPNAIAQSCNVSFYELGRRLGPHRILRYASLFGLNEKVKGYGRAQSVGRLPGAVNGPADTARLAIGQAEGFKITLLEAAEMVRMLCAADSPLANSAQAKKNLRCVREGMRMAVLRGTCKNAAVKGIEVAGKTGSPEVGANGDQRSAWFVGFAPYSKPEIVVVVFVNRGHGYDSAAPIASKIFSAYFEDKRR